MNAILTWTPRLLALAHGLFLGLFALDAFEGSESALRKLTHFFIHLTPTFLEFGALAIAWKWKGPGGVLFLALAGLCFMLTGLHNTLPVYLMIAGPPAIAGLLFIAGGRK